MSVRKLLVLVTVLGCGASAQSRVATAEKGLHIACAGLAEAMAQGAKVPAERIVAIACDSDRTRALIDGLILAHQRPPPMTDLLPYDDSWLQPDAAAPAAEGDAGAH